MKSFHFNCYLLSTIAAVALPGLGMGQAVSGTQLEIGPVGSDQVSGTSTVGGAIGTSNSIAGGYNLAVGRLNTASSVDNSLLVGEGNSLQQCWDCQVTGGVNSLNYVSNSAAIGAYNTMVGDDDNGHPSYSLVVGAMNFVGYSVTSSIVVGSNNVVQPDSGGFMGYSAIFGSGLYNRWENCTIVGKNNDSTATDPLLFAVGNGMDASHRTNAFEVHANGTILIPRQGDIPMGQYGNPE